MAIAKKLKNYLDKQKVRYKSLKHELAYTAQEIAAAQHVPGKQVVKSVLIKADKGYLLAVLPATHLIDFAKLKKAVKAKKVSLASEEDIEKLIPDFEIGAMPPFGNLYNLPVYMDKTIAEDEEIVFNAGTHTDTVKMRTADLEKLAKPKVAEFGKHV